MEMGYNIESVLILDLLPLPLFKTHVGVYYGDTLLNPVASEITVPVY